MTIPTSVVGLFCEDIREEKNGVITLVGIMPDNANIAMQPIDAAAASTHPDIKNISKICFYLRVNFDPDRIPKAGVMRLVVPNAPAIELGNIDRDTLEIASKNSKEKGNPVAGVISRAAMGFNPGPGVMKLEVTLGSQTYVAAMINFQPVTPEEIAAAKISSSTAH